MKKDLLSIFESSNPIPKHPPIWLMRQAGRYLPEYQQIRKSCKGFFELCYTPNLATEVTIQPTKRFNLDAAIIFSDILVIPDSMGIKVEFTDKLGPIISPVDNLKDFEEALKNKNKNKLPFVYEAISQTKSKLDKKLTLIGFAGGAWTLACYIVEGKISKDLSKVKSTYYNNPHFFSILIEYLIDEISEHLIKQIDAGAEIIQIFDSWAGYLVDNDYENLIIKPTEAIINKVRAKYPQIKIICFPRLSSLNYTKFSENVSCDALSVDQFINLKFFNNQKITKIIQGNLDPVILFSNQKELIKQRIDSILSTMRDRKFIFNLGHGVLPQTPIENIEFLINYIKK